MTQEDNIGYKIGSYIKNVTVLILNVIPNIIKNQIKIEDVKRPVPKHWKLSDVHVKDVINILKDSKNLFKQFYGIEEFIEILLQIQEDGKHMLMLINNLVFKPELKLENQTISSSIDGDLYKKLMFYFFLTVIDYLYSFTEIQYGEMSQNQIMANQQLKRTVNNFVESIMIMMNNEKRILNMNKETIMKNVSGLVKKKKRYQNNVG